MTDAIREENCHSFFCAPSVTVTITVTAVRHLYATLRLFGSAGNVHSANHARLVGKLQVKRVGFV